MEDNVVVQETKAEEVNTEETTMPGTVEESYKSGSVQYIDSREVAEMVEKAHKDLMRDIRRYCKQMEEINQRNLALSDSDPKRNLALSDFFIESSYRVDGQNRPYLCYKVTKKGCEFIAHKLTGQKGTEFTARYINRFHEMEEQIAAPGLTGENAGKLLAEIQTQNDLLQKQMALFGGMCEQITNMKEQIANLKEQITEQGSGRQTVSDNPFSKESCLYADRRQTLDKMATRIAELRRTDKMRILHLLYREIDTRYNISLDAYKSVLQSETGKRYNMLDVIIRHDWIYEAAEEMCQDAIERYSLFG